MFAGRVHLNCVQPCGGGEIRELVQGLVLVVEQDAVVRLRDPWRCHILLCRFEACRTIAVELCKPAQSFCGVLFGWSTVTSSTSECRCQFPVNGVDEKYE